MFNAFNSSADKQQQEEDEHRLLRVQPVLGLVEDDRLRAINHLRNAVRQENRPRQEGGRMERRKGYDCGPSSTCEKKHGDENERGEA